METTILAEIRNVSKNLPPPVGYGLENSLLLTTAFGTDITIPIEHFYTPEARYISV